jgi:hypothetical protein
MISNLCASGISKIIDCLWTELTRTAEAEQFVNYLLKDLVRQTNFEKLSVISIVT